MSDKRNAFRNATPPRNGVMPMDPRLQARMQQEMMMRQQQAQQDPAVAQAYAIAVYWRGLNAEQQAAHLALWPPHEAEWFRGPVMPWDVVAHRAMLDRTFLAGFIQANMRKQLEAGRPPVMQVP